MSTLTRTVLESTSGLAASPVSAVAINLTWTANARALSYRVRRNGVLVASPATNSYSDTGLSASTSYTYTVSTVAASGEGPQTAGVQGTTLAAPDTTAPTAPVITATATGQNTISVALTTPATDAQSGVASYDLDYKTAAAGTYTTITPVTAGQFPYILGSLTAATQYNTRARARDTVGNVGAYSSVSNATTQAATGGSIAHGAAFTVTGSGFGTRPNYNVDGYTWQGVSHMHFRYADFAGGEGGSTQSSWLAATQGFFPAFSDGFTTDWATRAMRVVNGGPSQSGKYITRTYGNAAVSPRLGGFWCEPAGAPNAVAYYFFKFRSPIPPSGGKWLRQYYNASANYYFTLGTNDIAILGYDGFSRFFTSPHSATSFWTSWRSVEVKVNGATSKVIADGTAIAGTNSNVNGGAASTDFPLAATTETPNGHSLEFPDMMDDAGAGGASYDFADIYVDFTRARVVAVQGTQRAAQCLTTWADGSISGRFNKGSLSSGAATLEVYNSSDALVASQSITVA